MISRSRKKEFRTSVILTDDQFRRVREFAEANDASIAWVLRQAVDRYLEQNDENQMRFSRPGRALQKG